MDNLDELWASSEWVETSVENHRWLKKNKEEIGLPRKYQHWFVIKGKQWPLISMQVWDKYPLPPIGLRVSIAYKTAPDAWFTDCSLPMALLPNLLDMLSGLIQKE